MLHPCLFFRRPLCFTATHSVIILNSTFGNERWAFPRYSEYDIVRGPGNSRVEWIRVCTPGTWQPVAESTLGPAPDHASTYRDWRRVYHFDVCWPRDSTGRMPSHCRSPTCPSTRGNIEIGTHEDTNALATHVQALDRQISCTLSSSASSVPDGASRSPSPPPSYDPNFDWDE